MKDSTKGALTFFVCLALLLLACWFADTQPNDQSSWERYSQEHHCTVESVSGPAIGMYPRKTVWRCDDGERIERTSP